jgi:DNA repair protein RadC
MASVAKTKEKSSHLGHRARLRQRFMETMGEGMPDYEMLELVLFLSFPRGDVKPLAKELIKKFDSLAGVLAASPHELGQVKGIGESSITAIKMVQASGLRMLKQNVVKKHILGNWKQLLEYCHASLAYKKIEEVRVLFVDSKNQLLADEARQYGTVDQAPLYAREVIKRALELHACSIILVHNHPSGDPDPSEEDILMTKELKKALDVIGLSLHDHLIIGKDGYTSLKALQLI